MNPKVDAFVGEPGKWQEAYKTLREIVLGCGLEEDFKWGCPCYTHDGHNVVLIHGFKEYCALLFFKGALMQDPKGILIQQTENVQAGRQIRFTTAAEITKLAKPLKTYIKDAISVEKSGQTIDFKETEEFEMPEELINKMDEVPALRYAFDSLTPGRQRGYILYFAGAKQSATREARIEKYLPKILDGKGLKD
jgi:uncharacterized protein YdeI (YjbR/CyaY-like superfamily)